MAEALGILASTVAIWSCAELINNYSLFATTAPSSIPDLEPELGSLEASLNALRDLIERNDTPSSSSDVQELSVNLFSKLDDARRKYVVGNIGTCLPAQLTQHIPSLQDPPPTVFILACIIYTFLFMRLREQQRNDRHQDKFILGGVGIGIAVGVHTKDWESIKGYVAWCAFAGLVLSAVVHWSLRGSSRFTGSEVAGDVKALGVDLK